MLNTLQFSRELCISLCPAQNKKELVFLLLCLGKVESSYRGSTRQECFEKSSCLVCAPCMRSFSAEASAASFEKFPLVYFNTLISF